MGTCYTTVYMHQNSLNCTPKTVSLNVNYTLVKKKLEKQCYASFLGDTTFHYDQWNITLRNNLSSKYSLKMPPNNSTGPCTSCTSFPQAGDLTSPPFESDLGLELLCPGERREEMIGVSERRNKWAPACFPPYLWDSAAMLQWNVWVKRGSHGGEWRPLGPCWAPMWQLGAGLDMDPQNESHQPPQWRIEETGAAHEAGPVCKITSK